DWTPTGVFGRTVRMGVFGVVSALLTLGAHRMAGGAPPPVWSVFTAMSAFVIVGWFASRRERSGVQLGALVGGSQLAAHGWFVLPAVLALFRARSGAPSDSALVAALFCHHGAVAVSPADLAAATRGLDLSSLRTSAVASAAAAHAGTGGMVGQLALMMAAHLGAALVVAWWLRVGERRAWSVVRRLVRACTLRYSFPVPHAAALVVVAGRLVLTPRRWSGVLSGRGPPVLGLALSR
ncbi:MAG: hypothetical protein ABI345_00785, partial [Jatrophihabitans sp.]